MQTEQELTTGLAQVEEPIDQVATPNDLPLQNEIDTLLNFADLISTRIATAKSLKADATRLVNARGWTLDLARVLGNTDPYEFIPEKQSRQLIGVVINGEIKILEEMVQFIENAASSFQEALNNFNQPLIDQIQQLRQLGDKTKDDQEELYQKMVVLIYPYFQMICQNLMETKFQYQTK